MAAGGGDPIEGRCVFVTGAGSGIGAAICTHFAGLGAAAVVCADLDFDAAVATARACGQRCASLPLRIDAGCGRSVTEALRMAERWCDDKGGVHVVVCNAGVLVAGGLDAPADAWERAWRVNALQLVHAARACVPAMARRGGGHIAVVASAAGLLSQHGALPYSVTKAAAVAAARWLALTHGGSRSGNVHVCCVCPQAVRTGMTRGADPTRELHAASAIAGRDGLLEPEAVAESLAEALRARRFFALPHASVAEYARRAVEDPDRWLRGMQRLQEAFVDQGLGPPALRMGEAGPGLAATLQRARL